MKTNRSLKFLCIAVLTIFVSLLAFRHDTQAASPACDEIDASNTVTTNDWTLVLTSPLQPGDQISIGVTAANSSPTGATLEIPIGNVVATSGVPGTLTYTVTTAGATQVRVFITGGIANIDWGCDDASSGSGNGSGGGDGEEKSIPQCMNLLDGRMNSQSNMDCAAPVAIYGDSITVYSINPANGQGVFAFHVSNEQLEAVGIAADTNVLLGQTTNPATGQLILLHRLTTGEYQLNAWYPDGKPYIFVWDDDGNKYHLAG